MTDDQLIKILKDKSLTDGLEILGTIEEGISAMREAMRLESIGFKNFIQYNTIVWSHLEKCFYYYKDKSTKRFTTDQLYNEYLKSSEK